MEILSTGEKIKRARVYKGYTLKDICGDKISVSKMSCIENDKVKAEDWILEFISGKLGVEVDYLKQGVREQLERNIETLKDYTGASDYEDKVLYNLKYSENYAYHDLSFKLIHLLFSYYLDCGKLEKIQAITSRYYDYCQKSYKAENQIMYYMDTARYLFITGEYQQSASYYNNVRKSAKELSKFEILAKATYNEAACYAMLENNERAYEVAIRLEDLVQYYGDDSKKADAYQMLGMLSLSMDKGNFERYEQKSYELYKHDIKCKARAIYNYATAMFDIGNNERAVEYIDRALSLYPKENKEDLVRFMLLAIDELIEHNILEKAQVTCDKALNYSIGLDNIKYIEKSYYYKALILQMQNNLSSAEMYMNLSLDALFKFGTKSDIYKRYMEMGNMYYNLDQTNEAIKYFNLAIALEKKI